MLDIRFIRANPDAVKALFEKRGCEIDVDYFLAVDSELNMIQKRFDQKRHEQRNCKERERATKIKAELLELKEKITELECQRSEMWERFPNLLAEDTPEGEDDKDNVELRRVGNPRAFDFQPKPHEEVGADLGILDLERGAKVVGNGFYYLVGDGALLANAVYRFAQDFLIEKGFELMMTPVLAKKRTFFGTGYFPFAAEENYKIEGEDLYLIGTSEQTLVSFHDGEIMQVEDMPRKYTAFSPCFRTETGSGKKARGAFRVHQFHKMEQIIFCCPEESEYWHEECQKNIEEFMQLLEIPYRVVRVCTGDMGAPGYKKYDVEAWFPGFGEFRETHSNTNLLDYQTRRLNIRMKNGKETILPHTISSTMVTDRAVLAILENNQMADGSVTVPTVLQKYMNGKKVIRAK